MTEPLIRSARLPLHSDSVVFGRKQLQFVATKVIPPRCTGLIDRPRLFDKISQLATKKLIVVKAPAGFGKTSLAVDFSDRLRQNGNAVAWLTIDSDDNEPPCFLFDLSQALQKGSNRVGSDATDLINERSLISPHAVLSTLINDLADVDEEFYLFLEDYHLIINSKVHEGVAFFLRHVPSHCHVVITTRTEPPLPLVSLRAQGQLLELDASALRFDLQETQNFIDREQLGKLDPSDLSLLHRKTEGWPAALRLVASTSTHLKQDLAQYVRNLSGSHRPISAYLTEMLDGLPEETVLFMLRTAILDRLSASLCDAVTGTSAGRDLLGSIEKRQLLLTPIDQEGLWFRFHPLLAEYLSRKLRAELAGEVPTLHRRASLWYASQGLWTEAVQHAIAAGDKAQASIWIRNCAMDLVKRGDLFTLLGWQRQFPAELIRSQPDVGFAVAWGMALALRFDESMQLQGEIELEIGTPSHPYDGETVSCELQVIHSVVIALKDDSQAAMSLAQDCLTRSNDPWTANVASNVVRFGHLKAGNFEKFHATPWIPYSLEDDRRNVFASVYRRCIQGMAECQQLRLAAADRCYLDALRLAEQHVGVSSVAAALPASLLAGVRYEQGRLDEAEAMLIDRESLIGAAAMLDCVLIAYLVMAKIAACRMNLGRAYTLLERAENIAATRGWGRLAAAVLTERARLNFDEGKVVEGAACVDRLRRLAMEYQVSAPCAWSDINRYTTLARGYLASKEGCFEDAISILEPLQRDAESVHNYSFALRVAMHLSLVSFRTRRDTEALRNFGRILASSAQAGIYSTILDEGADVGSLLLAFQENAECRGTFDELMPFVGRLIAGWRSRYRAERHETSTTKIAGLLSTRERDTLALIAQGLSNKEIARSLAVTPETVKSHVKHIFAKLNVEKRAQAVARAQSLGLVGTR